MGKDYLEEYRAFLRTPKEDAAPPALPFIPLTAPKQDLLLAAVRTGETAPCRAEMEARARSSLSM